jgi:hypothetical protein
MLCEIIILSSVHSFECSELPAMKFRNYLPHDEQLRGGKLAPVSLPKFEDPISAETAEPKEVEVQFWCSQLRDLLLVLLVRQTVN